MGREKPTILNSPTASVVFEQLTQDVFEFQFNRPKALNSLNLEMCHKMLKLVKTWHLAPEVAPRVVMMSGRGGKAFCAGGDVVSLYKAGMN